MYLHEVSWGGVFFAPMLFYVLISLFLMVVLRLAIYKTPLGRLILQEAWFDVALFCCLLVVITWGAGHTPDFLQ